MKTTLTDKQRDILIRLQKGVGCGLERMNLYWFMYDNYEKVTTQIRILEEKGWLKIKGDGMFREIESVKQFLKGGKGEQKC